MTLSAEQLGKCCGAYRSDGGDDVRGEHGLEDFELDSECDAAARQVLPGNHKHLYDGMRAGLWREFDGVQLHGRR
jgi:hypothetical protein